MGHYDRYTGVTRDVFYYSIGFFCFFLASPVTISPFYKEKRDAVTHKKILFFWSRRKNSLFRDCLLKFYKLSFYTRGLVFSLSFLGIFTADFQTILGSNDHPSFSPCLVGQPSSRWVETGKIPSGPPQSEPLRLRNSFSKSMTVWWKTRCMQSGTSLADKERPSPRGPCWWLPFDG